ncbi:MAG: flagellar basal body-associated FliL family protein [Alphaproteobacteria bacterium]|nr:flagellar basal body-associated FliL family protein [Alphaproteobacteria bacterium]MBV8548595.1 flagellar basal body-associated FliL family protein [Alphaproteobacteria bacterium]
MRNWKTKHFVIAYLVGLFGLAVLGYYFADYALEKVQAKKTVINDKFQTDLSYVELPRMNVTLTSAHADFSGRVRMDISLVVEKKYADRLEGFKPRINDRLMSFASHMDLDTISRPQASALLRHYILKEVNAASFPVPVIDVVFRQFAVM